MKTEVDTLAGQTFGYWTVLRRTSPPCKPIRYLCVCVCGQTKHVLKSSLVDGTSASCRCQQNTGRDYSHNVRHNKAHSVEYTAWAAMKQRCRNPNSPEYKRYGARGISYTPEWESFEQFFADVGPRPSAFHSLDRIDFNGNYEPANVHWATSSKQYANTRRTRYITFNGETLSVSGWARRTGLSTSCLFRRLDKLHLPVEQALTMPNLPRSERKRWSRRHRSLTQQ